MTDRGTYLELDGRPAVRFRRTYPHPVERVWAAVTEPAELEAWFPSAVSMDPREGGTIEFSGDPYAGWDVCLGLLDQHLAGAEVPDLA